MSLDLSKTALQIDQMARDLKSRQSDRRLKLRRAIEVVGSFNADDYESKRLQSDTTLAWNAPLVPDIPTARYGPPPLPEDFCVVAVDGSHVDIDRHIAARCFLINIGVSELRYGSRPDARLSSHPRLYASDDELVIRDETAPSREQSIEGAVLGAKRAVEEIRAAVQVARDLPEDVPTLVLMDGSLIMFGLMSYGYRDFVLRELMEEGFVQALEDFRKLANARPLAVASYISLPRSADVINALRLAVCPFEVADCGRHCGGIKTGQRECDKAVGGMMDREVFSEILEPGERSAVFASTSQVVSKYYQGHDIHFFYVHAGEEIGRVEVPSWIAEDEALLGLTHSLVIDQCRRGPGYPITLIEAHEQAVVTGADRQYFVELIENALYGQRMPVYTSEKNRSKRLRWV